MLFLIALALTPPVSASPRVPRRPTDGATANIAHMTFLQRLVSSDLTQRNGNSVVYAAIEGRLDYKYKSDNGKEVTGAYIKNVDGVWTVDDCSPKSAECTLIIKSDYMEKTALIDDPLYLFVKNVTRRYFDLDGNVRSTETLYDVRGGVYTVNRYYLLNRASSNYRANILKADQLFKETGAKFDAYVVELRTQISKGDLSRQRLAQEQSSRAGADTSRGSRRPTDYGRRGTTASGNSLSANRTSTAPPTGDGIVPIPTCFYSLAGSNDNRATGRFQNTCDYTVTMFRCTGFEPGMDRCPANQWATVEPDGIYYFGPFWEVSHRDAPVLQACRSPMKPGFDTLCYINPPPGPRLEEVLLTPYHSRHISSGSVN